MERYEPILIYVIYIDLYRYARVRSLARAMTRATCEPDRDLVDSGGRARSRATSTFTAPARYFFLRMRPAASLWCRHSPVSEADRIRLIDTVTGTHHEEVRLLHTVLYSTCYASTRLMCLIKMTNVIIN